MRTRMTVQDPTRRWLNGWGGGSRTLNSDKCDGDGDGEGVRVGTGGGGGAVIVTSISSGPCSCH